MERERTADGHYEQVYGKSDVLAAFGDVDLPILTSAEVAEAVGCSSDTARLRLEELVEDGELCRKEAGSRAVVYARLEDQRTSGYSEWKQSLWNGE